MERSSRATRQLIKAKIGDENPRSLNAQGVWTVNYSLYWVGGDSVMVKFKGNTDTNGGFILIRAILNVFTNQTALGTNQILHEVGWWFGICI